MPECVISNTSPLFYLHQFDQLALLQRLYGQIIIPEAVVQELEAGRLQGESVPDVQRDVIGLKYAPLASPLWYD